MAEKLETFHVVSAHEGREDDPIHVAFHEVHAAHPKGQAHVRGGQVVEVAKTAAVEAALADGLLKKATPTQVEAAKKEAKQEVKAEAEAASTG